jgi:hypothetical protein
VVVLTWSTLMSSKMTRKMVLFELSELWELTQVQDVISSVAHAAL